DSAASCGMYAFCFSSRRRHTRSKRDWSSDVCSSDLSPLIIAALICDAICSYKGRLALLLTTISKFPPPFRSLVLCCYKYSIKRRSEERRVGKECRSERARDAEKKIDEAGEVSAGVHR